MSRLTVMLVIALLAVDAVLAWFINPVISGLLLVAAVVVAVIDRLTRRGRPEGPPPAAWVAITVSLTIGALAVVAFNGWIFRLSQDSGGTDSNLRLLIGLLSGAVGFTVAYGYGRLRTQRAHSAALEQGRTGGEGRMVRVPDLDDEKGS